ncbi:RelA/SpoT domain-containing protein [Rhodospirillaceae bacterium KN72]|uniref:RelA/SpoT domain-containing protein n=1 Tax=Pacificispira spongiicola TaxID=2729598 RepID=A0A7Y0DWI8_9PROT|nr:RelA/SpoT domain-containing protein [Pacificispira spongiicola]NMM42914.1 RelA/SpoT domain-containing protein [Pacificispira spongiicola]
MNDLEKVYTERYNKHLFGICKELEDYIRLCLRDVSRIDRITTRPKSIKSFIEKSKSTDNAGDKKYLDPINQIQDQIGARIITFYTRDVERIYELLLESLKPIEQKNRIPDSEWEFGYFGNHSIFLLPTEVYESDFEPGVVPQFFELQIKTMFQHAWSEANHDLGYKNIEASMSPNDKRLLAFTSAQAWGADFTFNDLSAKHLSDYPETKH